jgi:hypothetical protein
LVRSESDLVAWGQAQESHRTVKEADAFVDMNFPVQMQCYYKANLQVERGNNVFLLEYDRDGLYSAFVGLAVAGSIFLAISVASLIALVVRCCSRRRSGSSGTVSKSSKTTSS